MENLMIFGHMSSFSALLPLGLSLRARNPGVVIKLVTLLAILGFLFDMISLYYAMKGINTYPINNLFSLVQSLVLLFIYREAFSWPRRSVYWAAGIYFLFFIINYLLIQTPYKLNSYSYTISGLMLLVLSLLYFRFLLKNLPETLVHRSPMVWINIAVLIYFGGNLFLFMLFNYFVSGIWILHNMLNITKNILFFVAIWQSQRKITSTSS